MPTKSTSSSRNKVLVQLAVPGRGLPGAPLLRRWASAAAPKGLQLTLRVVGAAEGQNLNRRFRKKNRPTNVLSFSYGKAAGDIVLCHPVVAREAREQGKSVAAHYAHLVVHGVLHLRGYDHDARARAAKMEQREVRILRRLGFGNPYELE
jgi:probable rRNA maturation factor